MEILYFNQYPFMLVKEPERYFGSSLKKGNLSNYISAQSNNGTFRGLLWIWILISNSINKISIDEFIKVIVLFSI